MRKRLERCKNLRIEINKIQGNDPKNLNKDKNEKISDSYLHLVGGCTANVSFIAKGVLYCANAGESRTLLHNKRGDTIPMSIDHKPTYDIEFKRITKAGGKVINDRINGNINLSRCMGDFEYKMRKALKYDE